MSETSITDLEKGREEGREAAITALYEACYQYEGDRYLSVLDNLMRLAGLKFD